MGNNIESLWDDNTHDGINGEAPCLFGRREILTGFDEITRDNLPLVLTECIGRHNFNAAQIEYLYHYMRGLQPVLGRRKTVRPEICNRIVENHASEIVRFTSAYFLGSPVAYVRRGNREAASDGLAQLNDYMFFNDMATLNMELVSWMAICGVGYKMVLPNPDAIGRDDMAPFTVDIPDPRMTFVVYSSGFGKRRMMAVRMVWKQDNDGAYKILYCGYTKTHYFEMLEGNVLLKWKRHSLNDIPIYEYRLNLPMLGSFEPAVPLLNCLSSILSNRADALDQFVQAFLKFKNCDVSEETVESLRKMGAIVIKSANGVDCDVEIMSQELNQEQTQVLVNYLYEQVLSICGMPTSTKGGSSTSDTGAAVWLRDGWGRCEQNARTTEQLFKKSEREFLRLALKIVNDTVGIDLALSEVDFAFTRRQNDNLLSKTQALIQMMQSGLDPAVAIDTCGLFNDPADVAQKSKPYLRKWEYQEMTPDDVEVTYDDKDNTTVIDKTDVDTDPPERRRTERTADAVND